MALTTSELFKQILEKCKKIPLVIDFWASWCEPCKQLSPVLDKLAEESEGHWELVKIDVDEHQELALQFGVQALPTVKLLHMDRLLAEFSGPLPEAELREWLEKNVPGAPPRPKGGIDTARELVAAGKYKEAGVILEALLKEDPEAGEAKVLLASAVLFEKPADAVAMVDHLAEGADHYDTVLIIRELASFLTVDLETLPEQLVRDYYRDAILALRKKDYPTAVDNFLEVLYRDKEYQEQGARRACASLFNFLGRNHPISRDYARRFEMAVFS